MAYVPVPKDLNAVKTKVMFNLTKRQLICFGTGALLGLPAFFLLKKYIGSSASAMVMIAIIVPFFLFGMYEKDGQPLEQVISNMLDVMFLKPKKRLYKSGKSKVKKEKQPGKSNITSCLKKMTAVFKMIVTKQKPEEITAQESIPVEKVFKDGICRVNGNYYTKTIKFNDINYQISSNEDKNTIFDSWCDFLNYFDSSVKFELSFININGDCTKDAESINIPKRNDSYSNIAEEYQEFIKEQVSKGNNGLIKSKYLSFGIEANSLKSAKPRLERIEIDLVQNFKKMGIATKPLNGYERIELMHNMFHIGDNNSLNESWESIATSGKDVKDFIAPESFEFKNGREFGIDKKIGAVSYLQILAPELNDRLLADFLEMESNLIVSLHVQSVDQVQAIKTVKRKITDLQKSKIEEQKKAVRAGYDMDIIPSDLSTFNDEAAKLLRDLQSRNERMFLFTFIVLNFADNKQQLENNVFQASSIAQKYNCNLKRAESQQEQGLMSCLPLAHNLLTYKRGLTTSSVAIFIPFTTQELFQTTKEALYCGLNALSNNIIMVDRKLLKNPNGLILGTPGSGKSFSAKREISNVFLVTDDDIIICDPEAEYGSLVGHLGGQVIKISPVSQDYINPMDLNLNYSEDENPLTLKSDFILSLCELIVGGKEGLQPVEKTIIDRCVRTIYRDYMQNPIPENMPILEDLYNQLRNQDEKEAQYIATALEIYVTGSLNVFNHRTNVNINFNYKQRIWRNNGSI